ncbi:hypothetical protein ACJX0J_030890, partial [Zea mays]
MRELHSYVINSISDTKFQLIYLCLHSNKLINLDKKLRYNEGDVSDILEDVESINSIEIWLINVSLGITLIAQEELLDDFMLILEKCPISEIVQDKKNKIHKYICQNRATSIDEVHEDPISIGWGYKQLGILEILRH